MPRWMIPLFAVLAVVAGTILAASVAGAQAGGPPPGSPAEQTHLVIHPGHVTRRSHVSAQFTLREAPGHEGVIERSYRVEVDRPAGSRAACASAPSRAITSGTQGTRVTVALASPRPGWCRGTYVATVLLQRGPYCPAPQDGQPPQPCPEFASQELRVGRSTFLVHVPPR